MWILQLEKKNQITKQIIFVSAPIGWPLKCFYHRLENDLKYFLSWGYINIWRVSGFIFLLYACMDTRTDHWLGCCVVLIQPSGVLLCNQMNNCQFPGNKKTDFPSLIKLTGETQIFLHCQMSERLTQWNVFTVKLSHLPVPYIDR